MKIENVDLPCMCKYYIAERYIDLLKGSLLHADVIISGDILHCNMRYDETIFYVLKTILDKTEKITIGDMLKYEYELDIGSGSEGQGDHIYLRRHGERQSGPHRRGQGEQAEGLSPDHLLHRAPGGPQYDAVSGGGRGVPRDLSPGGPVRPDPAGGP